VKDTTEFNESSTNHNANPEGTAPTLMSAEGEALSEKSAPAGAYHVAKGTKTAPGPDNPLHRTLDRIFTRSPR
jgi:hypothetical protein